MPKRKTAGVYSPGLDLLDPNDFEVHGKLGEGSYGAVHKVRVMGKKDMWLAVKKVGMDWFDWGLPAGTLREVGALMACRGHPNIVPLKAVFHDEDDGSIMLGFELCSGGDLSDYLDTFDGAFTPSDSASASQSSVKGKFIPETMQRHLITQIGSGLTHLHGLNMVHRDLKPMNILVSTDLRSVKICDFGMVKYLADDRLMSREISTIYYRAPEVLLSSADYGKEVDLWSVGCVFAEILCHGKVLFRCSTEVELIMTIFRTFGTPTPTTWPTATLLPDWCPAFPSFSPSSLHTLPYLTDTPTHVDFLSLLLILDPAKRTPIDKAMQHKLFQ